MPERAEVSHSRPAKVRFEPELITDKAGHQPTGGSGARCWGFNQSNIVRYGEQVYALSWRDDLTLVVFQRVGPGQWHASPPLPPVPQNGNLLVDHMGRVHVIAGQDASYHVIFDPPEHVETFHVQQCATADSRFGASMNAGDEILVAGGLSRRRRPSRSVVLRNSEGRSASARRGPADPSKAKSPGYIAVHGRRTVRGE